MSDDENKEFLEEQTDDEPEVEKEGSDLDFVRERLADESGGMDAYSQALDKIQNPQLKEIIAAIQEDEQKHQAALEQWMQENGGGAEEPGEEGEEGVPEEAAPEPEGEDAGIPDEPEPDAEPEAGPAPVMDEPADEEDEEEVPIESDAALEGEGFEGLETDPGDLPVEDGGDKSDLIEDIRAVLEAHSDSEEAEAEKGEDEEEEDLEKVGDVKTGDITLGKEGDEEEEDDLEKEDDEDDEDDIIAEKCDNVKKAFRVPIIKAEADQQIVYGVVSEPDTIDLQGDRLSVGEIRKACHKFMQTSQRIGKEHSGPAKADIIESYIAPTNFTCNGQVVRKGSWVMAVKIQDPDLWQSVKKGDITGFSIAGTGTRIPFGE